MKKLMAIMIAAVVFMACNDSTETTTTSDSTVIDNTNTNQDRTDTSGLHRDTVPVITDTSRPVVN